MATKLVYAHTRLFVRACMHTTHQHTNTQAGYNSHTHCVAKRSLQLLLAFSLLLILKFLIEVVACIAIHPDVIVVAILHGAPGSLSVVHAQPTTRKKPCLTDRG